MAAALFEGEHAAEVLVFGQTVDIWMRPRVAEVDRRSSLGVGAIMSHSCVRALMDMPEGMAVELGSLHPATLWAMEDLVAVHAVEIAGRCARRRAVPPVELVGFCKVAQRWSDVEAITMLRTHGPRVVVAPWPMAKRTLKEIDPDVGVAVDEGGGLEILRRPGVRAVRPSWQRWAIAETAYDARLRASAEHRQP